MRHGLSTFPEVQSVRSQGPDTMQPKTLRNCRLCGSALDGDHLDLGDLPLCNRFSATPMAAPVQKLSIACCGSCGLIQLVDPPAIEAVRPRLPWIRYNEADAHLDDLVEQLLAAYRGTAATVFGVRPFEAPLLDRFRRCGRGTRHIDLSPPTEDLSRGYPYLETWQARLDAAILDAAAQAHGTADIVSCRYLLEHCHAPLAALDALSRLLGAGRMLVVEPPTAASFWRHAIIASCGRACQLFCRRNFRRDGASRRI